MFKCWVLISLDWRGHKAFSTYHALKEGFLWVARMLLGLPNRPTEAHSLYWQINDSRWIKCAPCLLSKPAASEEGVCLWSAGYSTSVSGAVIAGERETGKSPHRAGKMPPSQILQAHFLHSRLVILPRAEFWTKMFCRPGISYFGPVYRKIINIKAWRHVLSFIVISLVLSVEQEMNTKAN